MTVELEQARKILALEAEAKELVKKLNAISSTLMSDHQYDLKLSSWDWNRSGAAASICPQAHITVQAAPLSERGSRR